ncbi:hypothetical protein V1511DRAFT_495876 [Dipodascopsis uninucleata]
MVAMSADQTEQFLRLQVQVLRPLFDVEQTVEPAENTGERYLHIERKFVHLTRPNITIGDLKEEIVERYTRIYGETLELAEIRDADDCDLDPEYTAAAIFHKDAIARVTTEESILSANSPRRDVRNWLLGMNGNAAEVTGMMTEMRMSSPSLTPKIEHSSRVQPSKILSSGSQTAKRRRLSREVPESVLDEVEISSINMPSGPGLGISGISLNPRLSLAPVDGSDADVDVDPQKHPSSPPVPQPEPPAISPEDSQIQVIVPEKQSKNVAAEVTHFESTQPDSIETVGFTDAVRDDISIMSEQTPSPRPKRRRTRKRKSTQKTSFVINGQGGSTNSSIAATNSENVNSRPVADGKQASSMSNNDNEHNTTNKPSNISTGNTNNVDINRAILEPSRVKTTTPSKSASEDILLQRARESLKAVVAATAMPSSPLSAALKTKEASAVLSKTRKIPVSSTNTSFGMTKSNTPTKSVSTSTVVHGTDSKITTESGNIRNDSDNPIDIDRANAMNSQNVVNSVVTKKRRRPPPRKILVKKGS